MSKSDSLDHLAKLGLNTPDYTVCHTLADLEDFLDTLKAPKGISLRTERGEEFRCPYFAQLTVTEAIAHGRRLLHDGYTLIPFATIDIRDCLQKGMVVRLPAEEGLPEYARKTMLEYSSGPGNVRDVEQGKGKIDRLYMEDHLPVGPVWDVLRLVCKKYFATPPQIVEWSHYKYPVGRLSHPIIFWEVRPWQ
jgi:hypothetical protein